MPKFPTDTPDLSTVVYDDKILLADATDSVVSKDATVLQIITYIRDALKFLRVILPDADAPNYILISDKYGWTKTHNIDASFNASYNFPDGIRFIARHKDPVVEDQGTPPVEIGLPGELAINLAVGTGNIELWGCSGTEWIQINDFGEISQTLIYLDGGEDAVIDGIGDAWTAYDPKPTEDIVFSIYGRHAYVKIGDGAADSDWVALVYNQRLLDSDTIATASADEAAEKQDQSYLYRQDSIGFKESAESDLAKTEVSRDMCADWAIDSGDSARYSSIDAYDSYEKAKATETEFSDRLYELNGGNLIKVSGGLDPLIEFDTFRKSVFIDKPEYTIDIEGVRYLTLTNTMACVISVATPSKISRTVCLFLMYGSAVTFDDSITWMDGNVPTMQYRHLIEFRYDPNVGVIGINLGATGEIDSYMFGVVNDEYNIMMLQLRGVGTPGSVNPTVSLVTDIDGEVWRHTVDSPVYKDGAFHYNRPAPLLYTPNGYYIQFNVDIFPNRIDNISLGFYTLDESAEILFFQGDSDNAVQISCVTETGAYPLAFIIQVIVDGVYLEVLRTPSIVTEPLVPQTLVYNYDPVDGYTLTIDGVDYKSSTTTTFTFDPATMIILLGTNPGDVNSFSGVASNLYLDGMRIPLNEGAGTDIHNWDGLLVGATNSVNNWDHEFPVDIGAANSFVKIDGEYIGLSSDAVDEAGNPLSIQYTYDGGNFSNTKMRIEFILYTENNDGMIFEPFLRLENAGLIFEDDSGNYLAGLGTYYMNPVPIAIEVYGSTMKLDIDGVVVTGPYSGTLADFTVPVPILPNASGIYISDLLIKFTP